MAGTRFAVKQERFDNLGQWKHTDAANPEWNKQALSWPVKQNGELNEVTGLGHFLVSSLWLDKLKFYVCNATMNQF